MRKSILYIILILALPLSAKILISPIDAMKQSYGVNVEVVKKNIMINNAQAKIIQDSARVNLSSKIFRTFKATKDGETLGYGILINKKVRSKNAVVLYLISNDSTLLGIEIIAFNEPTEYLPSKKWTSQFENITTDKQLNVGREIPTITGATLSARSITDSSRLAFAFYNEILKVK
ncbi:MAG: FMN-binding protein [Sulfurimonas sp.]|jgi:electron transport complex protein RnfG|nr:FMN-binding protein [Sulfurimonas sp.]